MKKQWNNFWKTRSYKTMKTSWSKLRIIEILDRYVDGDMTVLDAGSGTGFFSNYFITKGCRVYSLDYSREALEVTKKNTSGKSFEYLEMDLLDENLRHRFKDTFDLIFTDGLFEHFSKKEQKEIMETFITIKKKEGLIITFVPNKYSFWSIISPVFMHGVKEKPFTLKELTSFVEGFGQKIIEKGGINVLPMRYSPELFGKWIGMLIYTVT